MAKESEARIACPKCSAKLRWRPEYAGRVATCKNCSAKLRMPQAPSQSRKRSANPKDKAANRQAMPDDDDPFAFLDDTEIEAQPLASAPRRSARGSRSRGGGQSSAAGPSVKCPGCGANCAPSEANCPACDHSLAAEDLAAHTYQKNRKAKKTSKPRGSLLPEVEILGIGLGKILIGAVCLVIAGVIAYPMITKLKASNAPQPFYKVVKLGASNRIEVFDAAGNFINAVDFLEDGVLDIQNGGVFDGDVAGEVIDDGYGGQVKKATIKGTDGKDYVMKFTGWGLSVRVRLMTYDGERIRHKYDNGQFAP